MSMRVSHLSVDERNEDKDAGTNFYGYTRITPSKAIPQTQNQCKWIDQFSRIVVTTTIIELRNNGLKGSDHVNKKN